MQQASKQVQLLNSTVIAYQKTLPLCPTHHLEISSTCLIKSCAQFLKAFCKDCIEHSHPTVDVRYLGTKLTSAIRTSWSKHQEQFDLVKGAQRTADTNLGYCIDLFKQLRTKLCQPINVGVWPEMLRKVVQLTNQCKNSEQFLSQAKQFTEEFKVDWRDNTAEGFEGTFPKQTSELFAQQGRNKSFIERINAFAQKALIFSSQADQPGLNSRTSKTSQPESKPTSSAFKLTSFSTPIQISSQYSQLCIDLKATPKGQASQIQSLLQNFNHIGTLELKTSKVQLRTQDWEFVINHFSNFKALRQLRLHLSGNLGQIVRILEESYTLLRPIDRLHLKISDSKVDIEHVIRICNSFDLSGLWLTLTRCGLQQVQLIRFLKGLKMATRMTNLPMKQFHLRLSVNKLDNDQKITVESLFRSLTQGVAKKSIQL